MTRVYYHIEDEWIQYLHNLQQEYEKVTQGIYQIIKGGTETI